MREWEGGSSTIQFGTRHSFLLRLYGETLFEFISPPEFRQNKKPKPARIPPQTPPPRGRVHHPASFAPDILWRGAVQISSSGLLSKKVRILYNEYRNFSKSKETDKSGSARSADTNVFPPPNPESKRVFHAPRGSSFANTIL